MYPVYWDTKLTGCQITKLVHLQTAKEILDICGVDKVHVTIEDSETSASRQRLVSLDGPHCGTTQIES